MNTKGISPIIAVILMVAITVILGATIYVWVTHWHDSTTNSNGETWEWVFETNSTIGGGDNISIYVYDYYIDYITGFNFYGDWGNYSYCVVNVSYGGEYAIFPITENANLTINDYKFIFTDIQTERARVDVYRYTNTTKPYGE